MIARHVPVLRLYDDELLYSHLARVRAVLGARHVLPWASEGRGASTSGFRVLLPDRLEAAASAVPSVSFPTPLDLLERHTVLPYFSRFLTEESHRLTVGRMLGRWPRGGHDGLGHLHGSGAWPRRMRLCPECAKADAARLGHTWWRRTHQLPGVFVCLAHGSPLRVTGIGMFGQTRLEECPEEPDVGEEAHNVFGLETALRVARGSRWLLANPGPPVAQSRVQPAMRSLMADGGWLGPNGMARPGFLDALGEAYGRDTLDALGVSFGSGRSRRAAQRLWGRAGGGGVAPLACLLVLDFLRADVADLFARCEAPEQPLRPAAKVSANPRPSVLSAHRGSLLAAMRANPDLGRKGLRKTCGRSYCYLNRNDPGWLDLNMPPKRKGGGGMDWDALDRRLAPEAEAAVAALLGAPGRPVRVTLARVAERMGRRTSLLRRDRRLPVTVAAMERGCEDAAAFRSRLLLWAADGFRKDGEVPTWSRFVRRAAYRSWELPGLEPFARRVHAACAISMVGLSEAG